MRISMFECPNVTHSCSFDAHTFSFSSNDLAELEPKNKATWNADREKFKRKREISEAPDEYFESQTSTESKANTLPLTATDDTLPPGKGLQEDRKKLFAVQHRGMKDCVFRHIFRTISKRLTQMYAFS